MTEATNFSIKNEINLILNNQWFSAIERYKNGDFIQDWNFKHYGEINTCPCHNPTHFNKDFLTPQKAEAKQKKSKYSFSQLKKELLNNNVTNETLKQSISIVKRKKVVISGIRADGKQFFAEGYAKGTQRYNKKYKFKIIDYIKEMQREEMEIFAVTLTADIEKFGGNYLNAWQGYSKAMQETFENLRKHKGAKYVGIKESTKKGAPHAHVIVGFPKGTIKGYDKMKNRQRIFFGELVDEIKKRTRSRVFYIEKVSGDNVKYYLTKYVSKFADIDIFRLAEKKGNLSNEERKALICTLATMATNTRQFLMTRSKQKKVEQALSVCSEKQAERAKELLQVETSKHYQDWYRFHTISKGTAERRAICARLRAYLISICTNSPCYRLKPFFVMSKETFDRSTNKGLAELNKKTEEGALLFAKYGKNTACRGCFFSDFSFFMTRSKRTVFDEFFTEEDFNDDEMFMDRLHDVICFMYEKMVNERTCYATILKEQHKKHWFKS